MHNSQINWLIVKNLRIISKLVARVFPDFEKVEKEGIKEAELATIMEHNKMEINKTLPKYAQIAHIKIQNEQFEKTPKQRIMRFKYEVVLRLRSATHINDFAQQPI
ncbi:MAG: hypothetical protein PF517_20925 [Salinivirgaceae bacterium]|nr:hypothetical protein [Salinivirgaceae bacterium]